MPAFVPVDIRTAPLPALSTAASLPRCPVVSHWPLPLGREWKSEVGAVGCAVCLTPLSNGEPRPSPQVALKHLSAFPSFTSSLPPERPPTKAASLGVPGPRV